MQDKVDWREHPDRAMMVAFKGETRVREAYIWKNSTDRWIRMNESRLHWALEVFGISACRLLSMDLGLSTHHDMQLRHVVDCPPTTAIPVLRLVRFAIPYNTIR